MSDPVGPELKECLVCGAVGLPKRIANHDCQTFLARKRRRADAATPNQAHTDGGDRR